MCYKTSDVIFLIAALTPLASIFRQKCVDKFAIVEVDKIIDVADNAAAQ